MASAFGDWTWLTRDEWAQWTRGEIPDGSPLHMRLVEGTLLRDHLPGSRLRSLAALPSQA